jgi:hypothetical protein
MPTRLMSFAVLTTEIYVELYVLLLIYHTATSQEQGERKGGNSITMYRRLVSSTLLIS